MPKARVSAVTRRIVERRRDIRFRYPDRLAAARKLPCAIDSVAEKRGPSTIVTEQA